MEPTSGPGRYQSGRNARRGVCGRSFAGMGETNEVGLGDMNTPVETTGENADEAALVNAIKDGLQETIEEIILRRPDWIEKRFHESLRGPVSVAIFGVLDYASRFGNFEALQYFIGKGANPLMENPDQWTPLHDASTVEIAKYLVAHGCIVNSADRNGWTPLHAAAFGKKNAVVQYLLEMGADVTARDKFQKTPLHPATTVEICQMLLAAGADPNASEWRGKQPLHYAAEKGSVEICKCLIDAGASLKAEIGGWTPLDFAKTFERHGVVKLLEAAM